MASKFICTLSSQLELFILLIPFTLFSYEDVDWSSALSSSSRRHHSSTENTLVELPVSLSRMRDEHRTNTYEDVPIEPLTSLPLTRSETPLSQPEIVTTSITESSDKTAEQSCALEVSAPCGLPIHSVDRSNIIFIFKPFNIIILINVFFFVAAQILEEEIRRLKEARLCKVCLDEEVSIAYIPCGHIVTCVQCAAGKLQYFDQIMLLKF